VPRHAFDAKETCLVEMARHGPVRPTSSLSELMSQTVARAFACRLGRAEGDIAGAARESEQGKGRSLFGG